MNILVYNNTINVLLDLLLSGRVWPVHLVLQQLDRRHSCYHNLWHDHLIVTLGSVQLCHGLTQFVSMLPASWLLLRLIKFTPKGSVYSHLGLQLDCWCVCHNNMMIWCKWGARVRGWLITFSSVLREESKQGISPCNSRTIEEDYQFYWKFCTFAKCLQSIVKK